METTQEQQDWVIGLSNKLGLKLIKKNSKFWRSYSHINTNRAPRIHLIELFLKEKILVDITQQQIDKEIKEIIIPLVSNEVLVIPVEEPIKIEEIIKTNI